MKFLAVLMGLEIKLINFCHKIEYFLLKTIHTLKIPDTTKYSSTFVR